MNQMAKKSLNVVKSVSNHFTEYISVEDYGNFLLIRANEDNIELYTNNTKDTKNRHNKQQ
ncbi:hypothetical protein [Methanococcus voltae]|uniref:Uncharacterized protein n=1 Tax=Methanococcus voltae (strain ATCC BAA-1334 / A3) TaxID=456320 RepID=D7DU34_METV3|nr:hypothetical protein [Methanococcus voltae]MCS3900444.1 hypothetical protein [Methanococcus voltae]